MPWSIEADESAEERRLWADYYEAMVRVLELIRSEGTNGEVVTRIVAQDEIAGEALARLKQIRGIS